MPEPAPSSSHTVTTTTLPSQSSPKFSLTDLGLDPSDPLNLLLHNSAQSSSTMNSDDSSTSAPEGGSPPDWSQLSNLWHNQEDASLEPKGYPELMDFADLPSLQMDMDFGSSMVIEPSALHYDYAKHAAGYNFDDAYIAADVQYPFTFQSPNIGPADFSSTTSVATHSQSSGSARRLSITSSSSSSAASFSPVITQSQAAPPMQTGPYANDPAAEIAQRVRESAGVMLAVPMTSHMQGVTQGHQMNPQSSFAALGAQTKLPIPRLPRRSSETPSKSSSPSAPSSAASTPPPATPPSSTGILSPSISSESATSSPPPSSSQSFPQSGTGGHPRPKTSHTTIERRYRTNLNARIQSLRMAVPALRVLEDRDAIASVSSGSKKVKVRVSANAVIRGIKSECIPGSQSTGVSTDGETIDVIDERGFVDGVKVARKCSKANVLGKAVEYIRVLKRREHRLKGEQAGLKSLISGLVGGPALLREWEREWRERFGGEEKDEVEAEAGMDGDDSDDDEDEDEEGVGKKRKRARVAPTKEKKDAAPVKVARTASQPQIALQPQVTQIAGVVQPEKRKRGRPRKVVPPPPSALPVGQSQFDQTMTYAPQDPSGQTAQPQQYLLAVFALFSFFNSPMTPNYTTWTPNAHHTHTGTVLSLHPPLNPDLVLPPPPTMPLATALHWTWADYVQVFHLLVSVVVFGSVLCSWAGIRTPRSIGLHKLGSLLGLRDSTSNGLNNKDPARRWVRQLVCRPAVDHSNRVGFLSQVQLYRQVSSSRSSTVGDLCTAALGAWGWGTFGRVRARAMWDRALARAQLADQGINVGSAIPGKAYERLVVQHFSVEEAFKTLVDMDISIIDNSFEPIKELARVITIRLVKQQLQQLFTAVVSEGREAQSDEVVASDSKNIRMIVDAASELGGELAKVGRIFEHAMKTGGAWNDILFDEILTLRSSSLPLSETEDSEDEGDEEDESSIREIGSLLTAIVLYRRASVELDIGSTPTTSSALLSPPPTPTVNSMSLISKRKKSFDSRLLSKLRSALGSRVFEEEGMVEGVEDARDRVVDLVVEYQRRERRV
ncbi:hypothetical protein BDN72DRAFT_954701 [Pluteus cervinus]|uniref:Uncharacterized protein n=1 Tax=Pluteus cervinus TaxID=181527 RepID=A0ACD3BEQ8_9AGAR|nr:hypothetical protein BDN72DRAFT_954701 [Pluteus cervinus]